jgi:geranylgeranyl diphosphate synthase type II
MFDLDLYLNSRRRQVNKALKEILESKISNKGRLKSAMGYSLMAGGKRIRPILCMAAAESVGGNTDDALCTACAIEMIHTYSLMHDDLPAMDNDKLRRGKPTCHLAFDEATAILAGDALLTLSFQILSSIEIINEHHASNCFDIIRAISQAAGCEGMIEGQIRDITFEGTPITLGQLQDMHYLKTGALIVASIYAGAVLGGGAQKQIEQLKIYGKNIGLAFQVTDDLLNVEGDPELTGKATGTDDLLHKNTYPSLMGIDQSKVFAKKLINNALQAIDNFDNKSDSLRAIANYIIKRKK